MKAKTLLIAAATLAVGVFSSNAQVYSQNIVGYVNIPLTAGQFQIVSPALDADGTGTNNTVSSVFKTPTIGDTVYAFNGTTFDTINYAIVGSPRTGFQTNWFNGVTVASSYPLNPGQAVFYLAAANETNTQVGTVIQGTNLLNKVFPGAGVFQLVSSQVTIAGGLTSVLGYQPSIGDNVYIFNGVNYDTYNFAVVGSPRTGFQTNWFNGVVQTEPVLAPGQGAWIQPASNTNWSQTFSAP